jgi:ribonuclease P protein component
LADGYQAHIPTFQDTARPAPRFSGAQPHSRRTQSTAQPARPRSAPARAIVAAATRAKRFGLGAARRLRRKADFERLLRQGKRLRADGYTFFIERRAAGSPRLGILVSRRHSKAASDRNSLKRCIREAFRLEQEKLGPIDVLVRPPERIEASADMMRRLRRLLGELDK